MKTLYLTFSGRINRQKYILASLPLFALGILAAIIDASTGSVLVQLGPVTYGPAQSLAFLILLVPGLALGIKRLHDRNRTGWLILLAYVPIVNIWIAIELLFLKGTAGSNRYGQDPLAATLQRNTSIGEQPA